MTVNLPTDEGDNYQDGAIDRIGVTYLINSEHKGFEKPNSDQVITC